ncbi:GNAT family N-acetyltransferase [Flavobacterium lacisediminis]|uniref:GNAT family N-acetyltransferase n=1 Tax=Flavobacterium lacisediminis TaxID=2989705 RepID=A0ABT3EIF5_9FLAO|nr:GNAT family N-acetyltransferase [Flavobacterium lacisediminis]MCW1148209.1 GNAT family N-acetyltransferase [Flavobacterium lacisediminis]
MNFNFKEDYILENDVVRLQPLQATDYEELVKFSINEPELWSFNANGPDNPENLKKYIDKALIQKEKQLEYPFVVFDKVKNQIAGSTRFYNINLEAKHLEIGFTWYGKEFQGTSLNKNCKFLLLEFAFEKMQLERVGFRANNLNVRSINAMKSIGCFQEGIMRNFSTDAKGERIDAIVLSIIKNEWFSKIKENLKNKL